jgi:glycosyltransferase involved in cell wall biosynthesis
MRARRQAKYGVYFDPTKITSGQRFFRELSRTLADRSVPFSARPAAVLFNVSAPLAEIVRAKIRRQRIAIRIDGLYFDRLSRAFLATFSPPVSAMLSVGRKTERGGWRAHAANFLNCNYTGFVRMALADHIIYQSEFSRAVHGHAFARKPTDVIVNGARFHGVDTPRAPRCDGAIHLVTIYDEYRPSKRIDQLIEFVRWARESRQVDLRLTIVGYTGRLPASVGPAIKELIEHAPYISTLPKFSDLTGAPGDALYAADMYITFTFRDSCPNAVVEAMAHGLPVVGVASGGLPDIVGDAGVLVPGDDFPEGLFCAHRFESDFPVIDFDAVLQGVQRVAAQPWRYRELVVRRFQTDLDLEVAAQRYDAVMHRLLAARGSV